MSCGRIFFPALSKVFSLAAYQLRHSDFDTAKFMSTLSGARYQLMSERKKIKSADRFSVTLDRGEVLYFSVLSAYNEFCKNIHVFSTSAYPDCKRIALSCFSLFDKIHNPDDRRTFYEKEESIFAEISAFASETRLLRFTALSLHGSISRALPEIEYICSCAAVCERARRLTLSYNKLI